MSPGETEAGSAGMQPCPGIARWKLIEDDEREDDATRRPPPPHIGFDRFPHALKIPARSAESSLTQLGLTPIPAEPRQGDIAALTRANCFLVVPEDREQLAAGETVSVLLKS